MAENLDRRGSVDVYPKGEPVMSQCGEDKRWEKVLSPAGMLRNGKGAGQLMGVTVFQARRFRAIILLVRKE